MLQYCNFHGFDFTVGRCGEAFVLLAKTELRAKRILVNEGKLVELEYEEKRFYLGELRKLFQTGGGS